MSYLQSSLNVLHKASFDDEMTGEFGMLMQTSVDEGCFFCSGGSAGRWE